MVIATASTIITMKAKMHHNKRPAIQHLDHVRSQGKEK
jgi:hypothetical protein